MGFYQGPSFGQVFFAFLLGAIVGALFSDKLRPYRKYLWYALGVLLAITSLKLPIPGLPLLVWFVIGAVVAFKLLRDKLMAGQQGQPANVYGDAAWADLRHLQESGLIEQVEMREDQRV